MGRPTQSLNPLKDRRKSLRRLLKDHPKIMAGILIVIVALIALMWVMEMPGWVVILLAGVSPIPTLFISKPEKKWALWVSIILIVITAAYNTHEQFSSERTKEEIQALAYEKLSVSTSRFMSAISIMIEVASDGWLPVNEEEFFSRRSVDLICHELNIDAAAPVLPKMSWLQWLTKTAQEYKDTLGKVLGNYSAYLPAKTVRATAAAERSLFLQWPTTWTSSRQIDQQIGAQRPPLLCYGLEKVITKNFIDLLTLVKEVQKGEKKYSLIKVKGRRTFPLPKRNSSRLGTNRFGPEDLAKWNAEHPFAPSGKPPQIQK